ncbi:restriction endonuclease [Stenotrophomonas sp. 364]|uniref:nSTAND3 domain-containing NTPase n=1 Tax=Stenotrophomonas sp. 364 TaxID=2691571 RepID=UPI001316A3A8|nr:restriction endonuclease [Stenotrophomonas sp. 364]QHB73506.1 hypothetical protein GQ674_20425 [Stenotrophomonas sp. 364]
MAAYDFRTLNDKEFEVLCCDLLSRKLSRNFERFKPGRDGGVDGRYFSPDGEVVLQCKHWVNTPIDQLIRHLEKSEAAKVAKIKPSQYFIATSLPLSRADKSRIFRIFAPHIASESDILGAEDLNDILSRESEVERRHYKLWLASTAVLETLLNSAIHGRSDFLLSEIAEHRARYVQTGSHAAALTKLNHKHVVIITGDAGVGKTTLARNLLLPYASDGYEIFSIADSIDEAESVYQKGKKQIFYFDDFLGSNYLDAISGGFGTQISQFIRRVKSDPSKRFILTSRTTILNQGKMLIGALSDQNTAKDEFEISLQSMTAIEKAKILYNHMWHSDIGHEYREEIYKDKRYWAIIKHKNYNPRIISYITDSQRLEDIPAAQFWPHTLGMLNNPADVWSHPFDAQHDDYGRALILLVALNGRSISQGELSDAYYRHVNRQAFSSAKGQQDFIRNLRQLCGSMLNRTVNSHQEVISLFNPSIRDFLLSRYQSVPTVIGDTIRSLRTTDSLTTAISLLANSTLDSAFTRTLLSSIAGDADASAYVGYSSLYIARLYSFLYENNHNVSERDIALIGRASAFVEGENLPRQFEEIIDLYIIARRHGFSAPASIDALIEQACDKDPSMDELSKLANLMGASGCVPATDGIFREAVLAVFVDQIYDEFPAEVVFEGLSWDEGWGEAKSQLKDQLRLRLEKFGFSEDEDLVLEIAESYDFDDQAYGYYRGREEENERNYYGGDTMTRDIDDLFDRS